MSGTPTGARAALPRGVPRQPRWAICYSDEEPPSAFAGYALVVLDSESHPPLAPLITAGQALLGYISLGEVNDSRPYFAAIKRQGLLIEANPNWPGSFFLDIRLPEWRRRVVEALIPPILAAGFRGLFLDTLDSPLYLEDRSPKTFAGMREAARALIAAIRRAYPHITLMMNRAYALLPNVEVEIDVALGESVRSDYDIASKTYRLVPDDLYRQQVNILRAAQWRRPRLRVFTLDYWDPADVTGLRKIYAAERANGFDPYVATVDLDRLVPEPA
ncbi:MAG: endo alpha-1,4 polygalactosaminidase [Stellaceae bacterium]